MYLKYPPALLLAIASSLLTFSEAIPAFVPAKSERGNYGLAPVSNAARSSSKRSGNIASQVAFEQRIAAAAKDVASKYPVEYKSNVSDYSMWEEFQDTGKLPEPIRGKLGASNIFNDNEQVNRQNPDSFAPPSSDHGDIPQAKWPFALSHNRLQNGGWARQQNEKVLPIATQMASVQMRLEEGAYRELHWHQQAEWAYILNGTMRVGAVNELGQNEVSTLGVGDLWYFPEGVPHYLQAISPGGAEFLLVFDSGSFSEDSTLLLSDFTAHIPREVLVKNFPSFQDSDFNKAPGSELYIFPSDAPEENNTQQVDSPAGKITNSLTYKFSEQKPQKVPGGSVKIIDSTTFKASKTIAAAEVVIEPGAMRELHWHPLSDEWDFFLEGEARITIFAGQSNARTYDFQAGDVGYLQSNNGHYVEAIGDKPVKYLEVFRSDRYSDVSLSNWLALTPPEVIKAHMGFDDNTLHKLERFREKKWQIVPDNKKATQSEKRSFEPRSVAGKLAWN